MRPSTVATIWCIVLAHGDWEYDNGWNDVRKDYSSPVINLPQCHFVHQRAQINQPSNEPGLRGKKPVTKLGSCRTSY